MSELKVAVSGIAFQFSMQHYLKGHLCLVENYLMNQKLRAEVTRSYNVFDHCINAKLDFIQKSLRAFYESDTVKSNFLNAAF